MDAHGDALDLLAVLEDEGERIVTILGVGLGGEADDVVAGVWAIGPLVGVRPDAELEVHAAARGFGGDELESFEVTLTFAGLQRGLDVDLLVAGDLNEIGVGEVEVVASDAAGEVIAEAKGEGEAVEACGGERVEVGGPEGSVVEPGLVFDFGTETTGYAADFVGGGFDAWLGELQLEHGQVARVDAFREFEDGIRHAAYVAACGKQGEIIMAAGEECRGFRLGQGMPVGKVLCQRTVERGDEDGEFARVLFGGERRRCDRVAQFLRGPADCVIVDERRVVVGNDGDALDGRDSVGELGRADGRGGGAEFEEGAAGGFA